MMIKAPGDVPRHLDMLDLILTNRHFVSLEHENISGHEYRITEQPHGDALVRILVGSRIVLGNRRLIGVRPVHQSLCSHARQYPCQFHNFRNV